MAPAAKLLPLELVGEILCRLPSKSLARFRAVCKPWNALWEDKSFLKNYLAHTRPQFIVRTKTQICSVDFIDVEDDPPKIEVRHITTLGIPYRKLSSLVYCDGFLLCGIWKKGFVVWNPWLKQTRLIENQEYRFCGVGYNNTRPQPGYKILGVGDDDDDASGKLYQKVAIYDCKSAAWKFISNNINDAASPCRVPHLDTIVSLNGNLYWIAYHSATLEYFIRSFDFSKEMFQTFCLLPPLSQQDFGYTQVLAVFRGDRFSLLRQSYLTRKIEIFVTKHKIDGNGEAVAWMSFMTVSIPNFPRLQHKCLDPQPSYFVDSNKRLFVSTCGSTGLTRIYIAKGDVISKFTIKSIVNLWPCHFTYIPSFIPIPL